VRFTVTVSNAGPSVATGVAVQDVVPTGYSSVTNISDGGTLSGSNVDWTSLTIPVGGSVALTFDALVLATGSYTNYAQVTASDNFDPDSTPGNNSTTEDDDDTLTPVVVPVSDLSLVKSIDFVTDTAPLGSYNAGRRGPIQLDGQQRRAERSDRRCGPGRGAQRVHEHRQYQLGRHAQRQQRELDRTDDSGRQFRDADVRSDHRGHGRLRELRADHRVGQRGSRQHSGQQQHDGGRRRYLDSDHRPGVGLEPDQSA
jgi:uncharacterized repeat protein (TIGR01451 family)